MAGFQDPFSGFFNLPTLLWCAFAGGIAFIMLLIFLGFDNNGFFHRLDERLGIRNVDRHPDDEK